MNVSSIPSSPHGTAAIGNTLPERQTPNRATARQLTLVWGVHSVVNDRLRQPGSSKK